MILLLQNKIPFFSTAAFSMNSFLLNLVTSLLPTLYQYCRDRDMSSSVISTSAFPLNCVRGFSAPQQIPAYQELTDSSKALSSSANSDSCSVKYSLSFSSLNFESFPSLPSSKLTEN